MKTKKEIRDRIEGLEGFINDVRCNKPYESFPNIEREIQGLKWVLEDDRN